MTSAILLSGGMDSVALAFWQRPEVAVTVDYGHIAAPAEIRAAKAVAKELGIRHQIVRVDCGALGHGMLIGKSRAPGAPSEEWWPFRNQLLVTLGAMQLFGTDVDELMIGCVSGDETYADGSEQFVEAISGLMRLQEFGPRVTAPAKSMDSVTLIRTSGIPEDVLAWAHSCQRAEFPCGDCRGCWKRHDTYQMLGLQGY